MGVHLCLKFPREEEKKWEDIVQKFRGNESFLKQKTTMEGLGITGFLVVIYG